MRKNYLSVIIVALLVFYFILIIKKPAIAGWEWLNPLPTGGGSIHDVWGTSGTDVFAVGQGGTILHYDGTTWSEMESVAANCLHGIWGSSSTDVFAVGVDWEDEREGV